MKKSLNSVLKPLKNVAKGIWFGVSALYFPFAISGNRKEQSITIHGRRTLAKMAIFLVGMVLPSLTARLFPTAEEFLKSKGLKSELVSDLAPGMEGKIRVRTDNLMGKTHAFFDSGLVANVLGYSSLRRKDVAGYASLDRLGTVNLIYMKDKKFDPVEKKENVKRNPDEFYLPEIVFLSAKEHERIKFTKEDSYLETLFHEIRHHAPENDSLEGIIQKEADADYAAVKALATLNNDPTFVDRYTDRMAKTQFTETHNVALILDAYFNNRAIPPTKDILQANKDAQVVIDNILDTRRMKNLKLCDKWPKKHKEICLTDIRVDTLSALAQRRVQLFKGSALDKPIRYKQKVLKK